MFDVSVQLEPGRKYLVGVSGGRDSVALLDWLLAAGVKKLVLCHVNHRLRGRASGQDAVFVKRLAKKLGLEVESVAVDVAALAKREKISIETAAREARYRFFADCARKHRCPRLVVAHHADDQAETVLYRLLRGATGAKGMLPETERKVGGYKLTILRPLLDVSRREIDSYVRERGLAFREDETNAEPVAVRNRLRNEALPLLDEILEREVAPALARAARYQRELDETLEAILEQLELLDPQGRLFLPKLRGLTPLLQRQALKRYLEEHRVKQIDRAVLERGRDLLIPGGAHVINLPGGKRLRRKESRVFVE